METQENIDPCLFVGGPLDGDFVNVARNQRNWTVPRLKQQPKDDPFPPSETIEAIVYYAMTLAQDRQGTPLRIFVEESLLRSFDSNYHIFAKLINHYRVIK